MAENASLKNPTTQVLPESQAFADNREYFRGAPNAGVIAGPCYSPQLEAALKES